MPISEDISPPWITHLLAQESALAQANVLRQNDYLTKNGLSHLLDLAEDLIHNDPNQARRLAIIGLVQAERESISGITPRAAYLRAQTHAIHGEYDEATAWINFARAGYESAGQTAEALRTHAGLMQILAESGRYQAALDTGQTILDVVENGHATQIQMPAEMARLLAAKAHQNRGRIFELMGRPVEALEAYDHAESHFSALNMQEQIGHVRVNRGLSLLDQGRVREALGVFENALALFIEADMQFLQAQTLTNVADAHLSLGNYNDSLRAYEQARQIFQTLDITAEQKLLLLDTAHAYLALNLYPEALATYKEAETFLHARGMAPQQARALWGMGAALTAQKNFEEAETALASAVELFHQAENTPLQASVMLEQSALLLARGERGLALQRAQQAFGLVADQTWPIEYVYSQFRLADLLLPDTQRAETHLLAVQAVVARLGLPQLQFRLLQRLGHVYLLQGREAEAQTTLLTAIEEIETLRGTLTNENMRATFLHDKIAAYEDLVRLYLSRTDQVSLQQAFNIAERAKSRALVDLLTGLVDVRLHSPLDVNLSERLLVLQADLNAIYNEMLNPVKSGGERYVPFENLSDQALLLENEIHLLQLQTIGTHGTPPTFDQSVALATIQASLPADVTLVVYHLMGEEVMAFFIQKEKLIVQRHLTTTGKIAPLIEKLTMQWQRFRIGTGFIHRHTRQLEQSAKHYLGLLYDALIRPLETSLQNGRETTSKLVIIPHGVLHQIPFHALYDGEKYLLDTFQITYAPSATIFALCQQRISRASGQALVMGVADPAIPFVAEEVQHVSRFFPQVQTFLDQTATPATLHTFAAQSDVVHLACHGLFRTGNPMFSALRLYETWLTATEVLNLNLQGALVTLSACESGRSQVLAGDEILGLTRAFLGAGAATLIVSQWLVEDKSTAQLMTIFYERLAQGENRGAALRNAQLALKEQYAHPYYWAPFILIGHL
ncbi:MAG: CHAT domain-containing protein [Anaerolineales bacterium]|nr:CHAT domain-containing protein [Anaerolineales bacterium]